MIIKILTKRWFDTNLWHFIWYNSYGCFLKWWYPTTIGFPSKNDHVGVFWGYHYLRKHPYIFWHFGVATQSLKVYESTHQLWGNDATVFVEGAPPGMFKKKLVNNGDKLPTSSGFNRISEPSTGSGLCVCELLEANLIGEPTPLTSAMKHPGGSTLRKTSRELWTDETPQPGPTCGNVWQCQKN